MTRTTTVLLSVLIAVAENVRAAAVIVGVALCYYGISGFSRPAANLALGIALVVAGLYPYVRAHS
jgi:hypothetical protein